MNTENPLVIEALKDSYSFWIEEADVDGFRIDTAIYVEPEFWPQFLESEQGIFEIASDMVKEDFLVYGEAWLTSDPFSNNTEKEINDFFGLEFNSMLDFPLQTDIKKFFKESKPTSYLASRLEQRRKCMLIHQE
ncbi:MAG: alpha-amylase family glycosyl hydrolase [Defluviitoga tunisiensis]